MLGADITVKILRKIVLFYENSKLILVSMDL